MKMSLSEVARLVGGRLIGHDAKFDGLQVDSREIKGGELFCAVKGERVDGHDYVENAKFGGAAGALVDRDPLPEADFGDAPDDVRERFVPEGFKLVNEELFRPVVIASSVSGAMAAIALHFRRMLKGPVIGVTGSAGKTTVKEMVAAALSPLGGVLKSEGNLNTEFGVPMTWAKLQNNHKAGVIEMAMRARGQIAHLTRMSAPDIGVITSIGSAHIGELGSREEIARAKSELLQGLPAGGVAIVPSDSDHTGFLADIAPCRVITVGDGGDYRVLEWRQCGDSVEYAIDGPHGQVAGMVPGIGAIQAKNAAMAIAAATAAGVPMRAAAASLRHAVFPDKRMQVLARGGVTIWLDAYNSSPESCTIALLSFKDHTAIGRKIAILGDMLELGEFAEEQHRAVGKVAASAGLQELALVGPLAQLIGEGARDAGYRGDLSFYDDAAAAQQVVDRAKPGDAILIKASRGIALERVLEASS